MYVCFQCKKNPDRPHICVEAQQFGESARCCGPKADKFCLSFREVSDQAKSQWGENSNEPYLQAMFNSRNVRLD
jgi:hypothetical protein